MNPTARFSLKLLRDVVRRMSERNLDLIAAGVAFYAALAIFPAIAAVVALWGFVSDPAIIQEQISLLAPVMPAEAFVLVEEQVTRLVGAHSSTLGWTTVISLALALWSTRAGVGALVRGLDTIHGTAPRAGFWHSISAVVLTLVLIATTLAALVAVIVLPLVLVWLPLGATTAWMLVAGRWALLIAVGISGLWLIYRFGPNHSPRRIKWATPGAFLALVIWSIASWGFSTYLANFGNYNQFYGSLGAVIVLLMWFFISAYAIMLGAALNAALARGQIVPRA